MRNWKNESGMTLMELLVSILILALLAVAMGTGMDAAMEIYADAQFETDSAALAGILNAALEDVLMFSGNVTREGAFTNAEYGVLNGTLGVSDGKLCLGQGGAWRPLVNSGAYPDLAVADVQTVYAPPGEETTITLLDGTVAAIRRGGVFYITYQIVSTRDETKSLTVETLVRLLNEK